MAIELENVENSYLGEQSDCQNESDISYLLSQTACSILFCSFSSIEGGARPRPMDSRMEADPTEGDDMEPNALLRTGLSAVLFVFAIFVFCGH